MGISSLKTTVNSLEIIFFKIIIYLYCFTHPIKLTGGNCIMPFFSCIMHRLNWRNAFSEYLQFQMVQFVLIFAHQFQIVFYKDCNYPRGFMVWIGLHGVMFLFLFSDFYKTVTLRAQPKAETLVLACLLWKIRRTAMAMVLQDMS
ncbi:hypothetical protein L9F63_025714 [Diploptera punctata]|uniref:Very-long-chain 3-oxoacyl-CoA synthase n=1 Tax=Diploptera punctata TaxID=6984 RepID=A0AAD8E3K9_DIPPU|nr:hypothetical protein L9F63_025714 [Diploptera punctata]